MRRFKEFENADAWEQCRLGDVAHFRRGSFPQPYGNKDWYDGLDAMPFVQVVDVGFDLKLVGATKQKISKLAQPMSVFVPKDTVVVTLQGSIGRVAITQYDAYVDRTLLIFEDYEKPINPIFWAFVIQQKFDVEKQRAPGGTIKTITKEALSDFKITMPNIDEQVAIGNFFSTLDTTITFHQRKLEKVKALKTAYLAEMFPAEGERKPKRRFAGFTDAWEQCRLGDVTSKIGSGKTPKGGESTYANQGIPLIRSQNIYDAIVDLRGVAFISAETDSEMQNSRVNPDDILLNITGASIGRSAVYMEDFPANVNQHVCIVRPTSEYSPTFIQQNIASSTGQNQIDSFQAGGAREGLNFQQIAKISFSFPSFEEQTKIGTFFSTLDHTITFHQRRLEKLQNIKKAYLNEMFV